MRHSIAILFILVLGCSVATINFTVPAYADYGGGTNDDKGGGGDGGLGNFEWIESTTLTASDVLKMIVENQKSGRRYHWISHALLPTGFNMTELFAAIGPYYPALFAKISNAYNRMDQSNKKSLRKFLEYIKRRRLKIILKLKLAKEFGYPDKVKILEKMKSALDTMVKSTEKNVKEFPFD